MTTKLANSLLDRGWIPDPVIRFGIRRLLRERLRAEWSRSESFAASRHQTWVARLREQSIASEPDVAKEQHYEVPTRFFQLVLGPRLKYSSAYWPSGVRTLEDAEEAMLRLSVERARIENGHRVLDLGCGWGSLSLWLAEHYPECEIVAVSNSSSQGDYIRRVAEQKGLSSLRHVVADVETLELGERFDRVVSVEMFEHMRNYEALLSKIAGWMSPEGRLFVHIFCHRELTYPFETQGPSDWMAEHFFRGGLMPAADLLPRFDAHLEVEDRWLLSGTHYQQTAEAWLRGLDRSRRTIEELFAETYGADRAMVWVERWRVFFMACAELFGADGGAQWQVGHYLFRPRTDPG